MKKRILSFLLVAMMLVTMLPMTVFATETEMSDLFKSLLNEKGEFVIHAVEPKTQEDLDFYLMEYIWIEHWEEYGDVFGFSETYDEETSTCDICLNGEVHNVKVVFNYDKDVAAWMDEVSSAFPEEEHLYAVKDMEILNFWLNKKGNYSDETGGHTLGNYSGELKAYLENKNVTFEIDNRAGGDDKFVTSRAGMGVLKHNGIAYYYNPFVGSKAEHAFYIPDNTGDTKEEIMAALQARFDAYTGDGIVKVKFGGEGIYESLVSVHDEEIARLTAEIAAAKVQVDAYDAQIAELEAEIAELEAENITNQEVYNTNYNAKVDLEANVEQLRQQFENLEMEFNNLCDLITEQENLQAGYWEEHAVIEAEINALYEQYIGDEENPEYLAALADAQDRDAVVLEKINASSDKIGEYDARRTEIYPEQEALNTQIIACDEKIAQHQDAMDTAQNNINNNYMEIESCSSQINPITQEKEQYEFWTYNPLVSQKEQEESYKQYTVDSYENEDGEYYFLQKAAGDYWFDVTIGDETHSFVAIKDSSSMITPTYASADVNTNVTVSSTDTSIPLDTMISVDKLTSGTEYEKIIKILDVKENETFDISLWSGSKNANVTKLENGTFEVKIPVSDKLKGKELVAYYVDENDKVVEYEVTVKDGYAVFATNHFSIYTIAEAPAINVEVVAPETNVADTKIEESASTVIEKVPFTEEEKAQIEAGAEVVITLEVEDITETVSAEDKAKVEAEVKEVKDQKIGMYLDINMFKQVGDNDAVKVPELNGKIKIQLTVPEDLLVKDNTMNRIYSIIRVHDGETTVIDAKFDPTTKALVFETDSFSTYALVYRDVANTPITGDNTTFVVWMMLLAVGGAAILYGVKRKNYI